MFVYEWHAQRQDAHDARRAILAYLDRERSDECDLVLAEALVDELLANVALCGPTSAKIAVWWRNDGAAILEIVELEPGADPTGVAATEGWGIMVAGAMVDAVSVEPGYDGRKDHVRAVLPIRRRSLASNSPARNGSST